MTSYRINDDRQHLVTDNLGLVPFAIRKYLGSLVADDEDNRSIGTLGLCAAARTYSPDKGAFSSYAIKCIVNEVRKEQRKYAIARQHTHGAVISLNIALPSDDDEGEEMLSLIPDTKTNVESEAINRALCDIVLHLVPTCEMIELEGLTVPDIARREGKTRQSIYQRIGRELDRARAELHLKPVARMVRA